MIRLLPLVALFSLVSVFLPAVPEQVFLPFIAVVDTPTFTLTPTPSPTATPTPTSQPGATPSPTALRYICDHDAYNCSDFAHQGDAQAVFDYCRSLGYGDVHHLDANHDGIACNSLPPLGWETIR